MTDSTFKPQAACPYWSAQSLKCRICSGGLFIPLDDHIDIYCTTSAYPQCLQYVLHTENQIYLSEVHKTDHHNRRKYQRVEAHHKITLVRLVGTEQVVAHHAVLARTLDVSMGGMRLYSDTPLVNDSLLEFSFDATFPEILQAGTGEVAWCNKQIDEPGYQAGIAFHDDHVIQAMGLYLGCHYGNV